MASTTFINNQTVIVADWLNDVNASTYDGESISGILNGTTLALQTGGLDAINIDASQKVSIGELEVTGAVTFIGNIDVGGDIDVGGEIVFADATTQSTASYCVADGCMYENNQTISNDYTITAGRSANSVGPITIATGKSVTIPDGSRWVIL